MTSASWRPSRIVEPYFSGKKPSLGGGRELAVRGHLLFGEPYRITLSHAT
jgi:hypothetical protein